MPPIIAVNTIRKKYLRKSQSLSRGEEVNSKKLFLCFISWFLWGHVMLSVQTYCYNHLLCAPNIKRTNKYMYDLEHSSKHCFIKNNKIPKWKECLLWQRLHFHQTLATIVYLNHSPSSQKSRTVAQMSNRETHLDNQPQNSAWQQQVGRELLWGNHLGFL